MFDGAFIKIYSTTDLKVSNCSLDDFKHLGQILVKW